MPLERQSKIRGESTVRRFKKLQNAQDSKNFAKGILGISAKPTRRVLNDREGIVESTINDTLPAQ